MTERLRIAVTAMPAGEHWLDSDACHYVCRVLRLKRGTQLLLFDPGSQQEADAEILNVDKARARCQISEARPTTTAAPWDLTLIQAVGKGDKMDRVVRDATALGIRRLLIVSGERSVVQLVDKKAQKLGRFHEVALAAARQCGRGDLPEIIIEADVSAALAQLADSTRGFVLSPTAELSLGAQAERALSGGVDDKPRWALLIGPEGGLSPNEMAAADGAGFLPASLGPFVLRTETAAVTAMGIVLDRLSGQS